jgi:hypothetical protein
LIILLFSKVAYLTIIPRQSAHINLVGALFF